MELCSSKANHLKFLPCEHSSSQSTHSHRICVAWKVSVKVLMLEAYSLFSGVSVPPPHAFRLLLVLYSGSCVPGATGTSSFNSAPHFLQKSLVAQRVRGGRCATAHKCWDNLRTVCKHWIFPYTMWVPEMEFRLSSWGQGLFPAESSCNPFPLFYWDRVVHVPGCAVKDLSLIPV